MKTIHIQQIPATLKKGRTVLLKLEGELVMANTEEVRHLLLSLLPDSRSVRIVLQQADQIDLPFVQMLWSARNTAVSLQKNFTVEGLMPPEMQALLQRAGLGQLPAYAPPHETSKD